MRPRCLRMVRKSTPMRLNRQGASGDFGVAQYYFAHWGDALASVMAITRPDR